MQHLMAAAATETSKPQLDAHVRQIVQVQATEVQTRHIALVYKWKHPSAPFKL